MATESLVDLLNGSYFPLPMGGERFSRGEEKTMQGRCAALGESESTSAGADVPLPYSGMYPGHEEWG